MKVINIAPGARANGARRTIEKCLEKRKNAIASGNALEEIEATATIRVHVLHGIYRQSNEPKEVGVVLAEHSTTGEFHAVLLHHKGFSALPLLDFLKLAEQVHDTKHRSLAPRFEFDRHLPNYDLLGRFKSPETAVATGRWVQWDGRYFGVFGTPRTEKGERFVLATPLFGPAIGNFLLIPFGGSRSFREYIEHGRLGEGGVYNGPAFPRAEEMEPDEVYLRYVLQQDCAVSTHDAGHVC